VPVIPAFGREFTANLGYIESLQKLKRRQNKTKGSERRGARLKNVNSVKQEEMSVFWAWSLNDSANGTVGGGRRCLTLLLTVTAAKVTVAGRT
jgi:hypothetical protein